MSKLSIKSPQIEGRRRAGMAFGRQAVLVDPAKLKKGQLEELKADVYLKIAEVGDDGKPLPAKPASKGK